MEKPIFTTRPIKHKTACPLCSQHMEYHKCFDTHIWLCTGAGCPGILFEYITVMNVHALSTFLRSRK